MSELDEIVSSKMSFKGFFNHVFNFDDDNKANMFNMMQYTLLGIIPIIVTLKIIKQFIPEEDDSKTSTEIAIEVAIQLFSIFFSIWFIDKIIRYIPTYSGINYHKFNETNFILPILIILITMQTKLGAKINILINRVIDMWNGNQQTEELKNNENVKVNQPITNPQHNNSRADTLDNTIIAPPIQQMPQQNGSSIDSLPNLLNNNSGMTSFQMEAMNNQYMDTFEPQAANEIGGAFGSSF